MGGPVSSPGPRTAWAGLVREEDVLSELLGCQTLPLCLGQAEMTSCSPSALPVPSYLLASPPGDFRRLGTSLIP